MEKNSLLMESSWLEILKKEFEAPYMKDLEKFLQEEYASNQIIYPPKEHIFSAFCHTSFEEVSVVILGQDPYHNENQAHGLSFSVQEGVRQPPSLKNIFSEIGADLNIQMSTSGFLVPWAKQGVLLLNSILTVRKNAPKSHHQKGWETFTDAVIDRLSSRKTPTVFMLWGKSAKEKGSRIDQTRHLCLKAAHPSPYSAHSGFFGCKHFSKANAFLKKHFRPEIDWQI